ncbi:unnamed protein product [Zymoseptoria tritici ST99CH_1A5]|uniref:Uncharacterized protein n=1 Tax=Zymoseptoria tritici ST99CH_1A5 TaxID=1276529 RepID=A0A1Y6LU10_ZYMTR|nr:unnamed protein product [Zymoseptoria tritici ST99CH_1A5]
MNTIIDNHGVNQPDAPRFQTEQGNPRVVEGDERDTWYPIPETEERVLGWWYLHQYIATLEQGRPVWDSEDIHWRLTFDHPDGPLHQVVVQYDTRPVDVEPYPETWNLASQEDCEAQPFQVGDVIAARRNGHDYAIPVRVVALRPEGKLRNRQKLKVIRILGGSGLQEETEIDEKKSDGRRHGGGRPVSFTVDRSDCIKIFIGSATRFDRHNKGLYPSIEGRVSVAESDIVVRPPVPDSPPPPSHVTPKRRAEEVSSEPATPSIVMASPVPHQPASHRQPRAQPARTQRSRPSNFTTPAAAVRQRVANIAQRHQAEVPAMVSTDPPSELPPAQEAPTLPPAAQLAVPMTVVQSLPAAAFYRHPETGMPTQRPPKIALEMSVLFPGEWLTSSLETCLETLRWFNICHPRWWPGHPGSSPLDVWYYELLLRTLMVMMAHEKTPEGVILTPEDLSVSGWLRRPPEGLSEVQVSEMVGEEVRRNVYWARDAEMTVAAAAAADEASASAATGTAAAT